MELEVGAQTRLHGLTLDDRGAQSQGRAQRVSLFPSPAPRRRILPASEPPESRVLEVPAGRQAHQQAARGWLQSRNLLTPEECEAGGVSRSLVVAGNGKFSFPSRPLVPHKGLIFLRVKVRETTVDDTCYKQEGSPHPGGRGPLP